MSPFRDGSRPRGRFGLPTSRAGEGSIGPESAEDGDLDSYLAALAPDAAGGSTEHTGRFGSAQVFQLRLPALRIEQLRRLAEERGVSPGALVVDWVIDRLDREYTPTGPLAVVEEAERRRRGPLGRLGRRDR
jgi:hypothetical protein